MIKRTMALLMTGLVLHACRTSTSVLDITAAKVLVESLQRDYERAVPAKNIETIMSMYEEDAIYMPVQNKILKGKQAIRTGWNRTLAMNILRFELETVEVSGTEELISEVGKTTARIDFNGDTITANFKYLNLWRKQRDGTYKIHRAIYNQLFED